MSVPGADVVVLALLAVEVAFDRVAAVVEQEDDGLDASANHRREFLNGQLTEGPSENIQCVCE